MMTNKKVIILYILNILKQHTNENKSLTQQDIIRKLRIEYDIECDRRTVKSNIDMLCEAGYDIATDDGYRLVSREFDDSELRMLIDSVLYAKHISVTEAKRLIDKLKKLSDVEFSKKIPYVYKVDSLQHTDNPQVMINVDRISEAIAKKKKISFTYMEYGLDLKLHPKRNITYVVNPYYLAVSNGRYYLVANYDKYNDISNYRIDKIKKVEILEHEPCKEITTLDDNKNGFDLDKYMAEHIYMYGGESDNIILRAEEKIIGELVDWFGDEIRIKSIDGEQLELSIKCNINAMKYLALQYGEHIEIVEPKELRADIKKIIYKMQEKYTD